MNESEVEATVEALLDRAWASIAAAGWSRYQLHGRGALLASMRMLQGTSNSMDYVTPSEQAPLPEWLSAAVRDYNPETSVVLVFIADDVFRRASGPVGTDLMAERLGLLSGPAYFKVATRLPPPPECARQSAH